MIFYDKLKLYYINGDLIESLQRENWIVANLDQSSHSLVLKLLKKIIDQPWK